MDEPTVYQGRRKDRGRRSGQGRRKRARRSADIAVSLLGTLALGGWIYLGSALDPVGDLHDVGALIGVCWIELGLAVLAYRLLRGRGDRRALAIALGFAALFRIALLPAGAEPSAGIGDLVREARGGVVVYETHLLYDNDVWRYLWDGRVQQLGLDPYRSTPTKVAAAADAGDPDAEALLEDDVWWEIHQRIGYPDHPSVYPPLLQLLFRGLAVAAPASVLALKLVLTLADLGVCLLLVALLRRLGRPPAAVVLYAWHPLPIKEIAGSGHVDGLMSLLMVAAILALITGRQRGALVAWAGAIAIKLVPAALVGLVLGRTAPRRWWWALATSVLLALPFLAGMPAWLASVRSFAVTWRFNAGAWAAVGASAARLGAEDPAAWADVVCGVALLATIAVATVLALGGPRPTRDVRAIWAVFVALAAVPLLSPAVMPWYLLWALPFAVAAGRWPFVVLSALAFLSYLVYVDQREHLWWLVSEHGTFALLLGVDALHRRRRRARGLG